MFNENPWSEWLETWHSSSTRHCVAAYWCRGQNTDFKGARVRLGLGLRNRRRLHLERLHVLSSWFWLRVYRQLQGCMEIRSDQKWTLRTRQLIPLFVQVQMSFSVSISAYRQQKLVLTLSIWWCLSPSPARLRSCFPCLLLRTPSSSPTDEWRLLTWYFLQNINCQTCRRYIPNFFSSWKWLLVHITPIIRQVVLKFIRHCKRTPMCFWVIGRIQHTGVLRLPLFTLGESPFGTRWLTLDKKVE